MFFLVLKLFWLVGYAQVIDPSVRDVIIIGAGISGLASAEQLVKEGYNPLILEAQDRIGGRLWTMQKWDTSLELGAAWLHGYENNPIYQLAIDYDLQMHEATIHGNSPGALSALTVYDVQGEKLGMSDKSLMRKILDEFESFLHVEQQKLGEDIPLQYMIEQFIQDKKYSKAQESKLWYGIAINYLYYFGTPLDKLSGKAIANTQAFGQKDMIFENGFVELAEKMADGLDVLTDHFVTSIDYNRSIIEVETNRGKFYAKKVIVTLPLGVLQNEVVQFSPELPLNKRQAIESLGMGLANRVYLLFEDTFWDIGIKEANHGWMDVIGYMADSNYGWMEFIDFYKRTSRPILLAFSVGGFAKQIEGWSDSEIVESIMQTLRTLYGEEIPEPIDYDISRWSFSPFSYGSYSVYLVGSSSDDVLALAKPINGKIFFAGEATNVDYFSSVHGAYLSGIRAANEIFASDSILDGHKNCHFVHDSMSSFKHWIICLARILH